MTRVFVMAVLFVAPLLAGCLGDDGDLRPVAGLEAPRWEAGFQWTWSASRSATWTYENADGSGSTTATHTGEITHRVVHTETPLFGEAAYWLETDDPLTSAGPVGVTLFDRSGISVVAQKDLSPIATVFPYTYRLGTCVDEHYEAVEVDAVPLFRFPLASGATWQRDLEDGPSFVSRVLGAEPVAGFEAVRLQVEGRSEPDPVPVEDGLGGFETTMDVWYAEEVRNIIRLVTRTEATMVDEEGGEVRIVSKETLELLDHRLVVDAEAVLPEVRERAAEVPFEHRPLPVTQSIVSDRSFPIDAAEDDLTARFGIASDLAQVMGPDAEAAPEVLTVDTVPAYEALDIENETLLWRFDRAGETWHQAEGTTVEVELPPGGAFDVAVERVPLGPDGAPGAPATKCGMSPSGVAAPRGYSVYGPPEPAFAQASFEVEWTRPFQVDHEVGPAADVDLFALPLEPGARLMASYQVEGEGVVEDEGGVRIRFEDGSSARLRADEAASVSRARSGEASAVWEARGGGPFGAAGWTFGHRVEGTLRVTY